MARRGHGQNAASTTLNRGETSVPRDIDRGSRKSILLVHTFGDEEVMRNVREELKSYGWDIIDVRHPGETGNATDLFQLLGEFGAMAAVRVSPQIGQVELCVAQDQGGVVETLRNDSASVDAQVLTLRITEALRARGLELETATTQRQPPKPRSAPTSETHKRREAPPDEPRTAAVPPTGKSVEETPKALGLWLAAAPAITASPGGLGPTWGAWIELELKLSPIWSISAIGSVPVRSNRVDANGEGTAQIDTYLGGLSVGAALLRWGRWSASLGAGGSVAVTTMVGYAQANDFRGANDTVVAFAPDGYARLDFALSPNWRLCATAFGGVTIPKVGVSFGKKEDVIRTWGQPFFIVALGIETHLLGR